MILSYLTYQVNKPENEKARRDEHQNAIGQVHVSGSDPAHVRDQNDTDGYGNHHQAKRTKSTTI
jgi:hypothetical protein